MRKLFFLVFVLVSGTITAQPNWTVVTYTSSTTAYGIVTINGNPASAGDWAGAFVGAECRAKQEVIMNDGKAYINLQIQGESVETVTFKVWDKSESKELLVGLTVQSNPGSVIGNPPGYLAINAESKTLNVSPVNNNVQGSPSGTANFTITSNSSWTAESDQPWCTITPSGTGNGTAVASYAANTTSIQRIATLTITVSGITPVKVTVTQEPCTPPSAPTVGTITQPTCSTATGGVILNGLPATGTWTLTRTPGGITTTGTGTSKTITGLANGTYTYTVTNEAGCISAASANVVIDAAPSSPTAPTIGTITQPTCSTATGSVVLNGLPATGTWTLTRTPGGITTTGTGTSKTITGLTNGTYTYTVTNEAGCISVASANVVIDVAPSAPTAPTVGTITQPTCSTATGGVVLNGLPATGTWTLTRTPGGITTTGTGTSKTITGLTNGTYTYTVTNAAGCISGASGNVLIINPVIPAKPVITANDTLLFSDAVIGNQWYNSGGKIIGATSQTYKPTTSDNYYVIVSISDCNSPMSEVISFKLTGVELVENKETIKVYPNPTNGHLVIEGLTEGEKTEIALYNLNSKLVKVHISHSSQTQMDISEVVSGVFLMVINNRFEQAVKIIKK